MVSGDLPKDKQRAVEVRDLVNILTLSTIIVLFATISVACFFVRFCICLVLLQLVSQACSVQICVLCFRFPQLRNEMCSIVSAQNIMLLLMLRFLC